MTPKQADRRMFLTMAFAGALILAVATVLLAIITLAAPDIPTAKAGPTYHETPLDPKGNRYVEPKRPKVNPYRPGMVIA